MPFEGEFASYEPLRRVLENEKVKDLRSRFKIRVEEGEEEEFVDKLLSKNDLPNSNWQPNYLIGIDGSVQSSSVPDTGFPGSEIGYITASGVLILMEKVRQLEDKEFIDPKEFRETEKPSTFDAVFPGCNVIIDEEEDAKSSMRKTLFEQFDKHIEFTGGETLLETYQALLKIKIEKGTEKNPPKCPCDKEEKFKYGYDSYKCDCGKDLYSTDAMRLHELFNPIGTCGEMYGQIMSTIEKLWLIHILRAFEKKGWLPELGRLAFVLDGSLAVFSTSSWLTKSINKELIRINQLQKTFTGKDLLIIGVEKTGQFVNHFNFIGDLQKDDKDKFPKQSILLLDNGYINRNIKYGDPDKKEFGKDTYFGRKFFYKTHNGYKITASVATFSEQQQSLQTANPNQFPRLVDIMTLLDELTSNRYPNSVTPLISAHSEAAIPLNLGKRLFEDIAREIRNRPTV